MASLASQPQYLPVTVSLRAPRVAVLIDSEHWTQHAKSALRLLSSIWGGVGSVVVPVGPRGEVSEPLVPALRHFDPDYIARLGVTHAELEELHPGAVKLAFGEHGSELDPAVYRALLEQVGSLVTIIGEEAAQRVADRLAPFREPDGEPRLLLVHADQEPPPPLARVPNTGGSHGTTGDALVDLALYSRCGMATDQAPDHGQDLGLLSVWELWSALIGKDNFTDPQGSPSAFAATAAHLSRVNAGFTSRHGSSTLVVGDQAVDFSLAMLMSRGGTEHVPWVPSAPADKKARLALASALSQHTGRGRRSLNVMSASLDSVDALRLAKDMCVGSFIDREVGPIGFLDPRDWDSEARTIWAVNGAWDQRSTVTAVVDADGSAEMAVPTLHVPPVDLESSGFTWIVEQWRLDHQPPSRRAIAGAVLLAEDQNPRETFLRASDGAIAYEASRWDFIPSGASVHGRLAAPRLRWPSLFDMLNAIATGHGHSIRYSDAGRRTRFAIRLWGSRRELARDLVGVPRLVLDAFQPPQALRNGAYVHGVVRQGIAYTTFAALKSIGEAGGWQVQQLRAWLDARLTSGAISRGLVLGCEDCTWVDFYRLADVGDSFMCKRCGAYSGLTQPRWRAPDDEPQWFYDLHPNVLQLLSSDGDIPLLAVERYLAASRRPGPAVYEFELVDGSGRPVVEMDFALMDGSRLVLGEAKKGGTLDGRNERDRRRDAAKLALAAETLEADELCLASASTWAEDTWPLMRQAWSREERARISRLEDVRLSGQKPSMIARP